MSIFHWQQQRSKSDQYTPQKCSLKHTLIPQSSDEVICIVNTFTGRWTTCGPSKSYPLAGRWTQCGPSIQQFAKNRGILPAGSRFGSYMVHELYCYTNKQLWQSSLIISACQCSVGNYWVWLWCISRPLATALALKCLPCILLFIFYFDVSGEYFGILNCNLTWFTMSPKEKNIVKNKSRNKLSLYILS